MTTAALIALDWGTSNLRASLLDTQGLPLAARSAPGGVMAVPDHQFETALMSLCADWIEAHEVPLMASGMVGSRQGWREAPYLDCPADPQGAAQRLTVVTLASLPRHLHIAPGLRCLRQDGSFDVMRGEEIQVWGAALPANTTCVLPGTHSKWVQLGAAQSITGFRTFMTGELFGVLSKHSILGRLMAPPADARLQTEHFEAGARLGLRGFAELSSTVFAARTAGLMDQVPADGLSDFLSGILIGGEVGATTHAKSVAGAVTLIGDEALCERYALALMLNGTSSTRAVAGSTTRGQWQIAKAAGLLDATTTAQTS